jgi:hypothetical protein
MTYWKPETPLTQLQRLCLAVGLDTEGGYDVTPEKLHLIPYMMMSSPRCSCRGSACIKCVGPLFRYVVDYFVPRDVPTDRMYLYPIRGPEGDLYATSESDMVRLIGQVLSRGSIPIVHRCCPPLQARFIPGRFKISPSFESHVLELPGGLLIPPWRPDLDTDTVAVELEGLQGRLNVVATQGTIPVRGRLAEKVARFRLCGFRYTPRQRLHTGPGLRVLCPPSLMRCSLGDVLFPILDGLKHKQHLGLPLRLFTLSFQPDPLLTGVVMWRAHNELTMRRALSSMNLVWTTLPHSEILTLGLAPDMQVMWARLPWNQ